MANEEHLAILKQGVEVWNQWRGNNLHIIPDLRYANLSLANLSLANLSLANLSYASLSEANLNGSNLSDANLKYAVINDADVSEANLSGADLDEAILSFANLSGADLSRSNLSKADLNSATLNEAKLFRANLSEANLSEAELLRANLSEANLSEAKLLRANLSEANLIRANLSQSQVIGTNFHNANLTGADIRDWQINDKTNLEEIICEYVVIRKSFWTERRPTNGNFVPGEFANLYKIILENTDLILSRTIQIENTVNNQGVQFYSNQTTDTYQNLGFYSKTEIKIAEALDRTGVLFLTNSLVRLNISNVRANKEANFLIYYNGKWGVLEVDKPHQTAERRFEEQEIERIFRKIGIKVVERFDAERCYNNPDEVVQEFFHMIEIGYY
ncbi:MAG: pentapeptide repeat-containing protein [Cuspidothrix sp.]